jgi:hypothetical protein
VTQLACLLLSPLLACDRPAGLGASCRAGSDCTGDLQCLEGLCSPRCALDVECGDGLVCDAAGECREVTSSVGDPCRRERDCGPGQACKLVAHSSADGTTASTCQPQEAGAVTGAACQRDDDCRSGSCALGRCTEICAERTDCFASLDCVALPRLVPHSLVFQGCFQGGGTLELEFEPHMPQAALRIPVPGHARSVAIVSHIRERERDQLVGVTELRAPDGQLLYRMPESTEEFYANLVRHQPTPEISTLLLPSSSAVQLSAGFYSVDLASLLPIGRPGTANPHIRAIYKLDDGAQLDLHFYFLNLEDHPCAAGFDLPGLTADTARRSTRFQTEYLPALTRIFEPAGIRIGTVTYDDLLERPDLDGLDSSDLPALLRLGRHATGISVFFVRSLRPLGLQALIGGNPGPPLTPGSPSSGIALALDTLCYRDWTVVARTTAHAIARYMGLFRNREPDGHLDPVEDSDGSTRNLMFFGEFGGTDLSEGQVDILRRSPVLR